MAKFNKVAAAREDDYCTLSAKIPDDFVAKQIIYRELVPQPNLDDSFYKDIDKPTRFKAQKFDQWIRRIAGRGYWHNDYDLEEDYPLDLPVWKSSWIVIQLALNSRRTFSNPAVKLKTEDRYCLEHLYGGLRYVDGAGNAHEEWIPNCTMIYFAAILQKGDGRHAYKQGLNYYVDPGQVRLVPIDPDIRYPGNGGQNNVEGPA